jgi:uncharacterized protein YndB with AHSA1/START domain
MLRIIRETDIFAGAETVFDIISDIAQYPQWNPWNVRGEGTVAPGAVVRITARFGSRQLVVDHRILDFEPHRVFRWGDLGWFTRLAYGETVHQLEPRGDHVRHRVELRITGPLSWLVALLPLKPLIERGLSAETLALKARAEARGRS